MLTFRRAGMRQVVALVSKMLGRVSFLAVRVGLIAVVTVFAEVTAA